jgi:hypothetical protein
MQALLLGAVTIEAAEFFAYLPEVEACPWLNDVATNTGAGAAESLGVMFAKAAWDFGRYLPFVDNRAGHLHLLNLVILLRRQRQGSRTRKGSHGSFLSECPGDGCL